MHLRQIALISLLAASPAALNANGFRLVSQDAYAAARGEAFAATADNPSAIHYNPAGISQLEGQQFRVGGYALHFEPTFRAPDGKANAGESYDIEENDALAPQLYYTYGIPDSPLTLGLGVYAPHGATVAWPQDTGFRTVAIDAELTYLRINPVASLEIRPGLSFAIGVMIDDAELSTGQGLWEDAISQVFKNSFKFEGDALRCGYNLGLLWQINDQWVAGASFRSANRLNFEGQTLLEYEPFVGGVTKNPAEMELEFPYTAVMGISYRPTKNWNIEFNADYSNWSAIDTTSIKQKNVPPFPVLQNIPVTLGWKDSWILKFGATRYFDNGWYASAGYVFNENSVSTDYYSPTAADLDRHFLTMGIGRQWSRYNVDLAYQYGFAPSRTVSGSTPSSIPALAAGQTADGTYDFESHGLLLSFGVKF
jgi:long-chain fatty acid transport protein